MIRLRLTLTYLAFACAPLTYAQGPWQETVLHYFMGQANGSLPVGGLARDSAGNLYGTTSTGGTAGRGTVYRLDPAGHEVALHSFTGDDGWNPQAGPVLDSAGNLYGTTFQGGKNNQGVIYKLDPTGAITVLYSFTNSTTHPNGSLTLDSAGNIYGTIYRREQGLNPGMIYKLDTHLQFTVLYHFIGGRSGAHPLGRLTLDANGSLYGAAVIGGAYGYGVVYKLDLSANHLSLLYNFTGQADGGFPQSGVLLDGAGSLYGTTGKGGAAGKGVLYKLGASGTLVVLHSFLGQPDGAHPSGDIARDSAGNLYGSTRRGGSSRSGTVFKVDATGRETVLHSFAGTTDGSQPRGGVIVDDAGNLYGATDGGGQPGLGVVFTVDAAGHEKVLHAFSGGKGGSNLSSGVIRDSSGNLYGTASSGGKVNLGVVYKVNTAGKATVLHEFTGLTTGVNPLGGVIQDAAGSLYGATEHGGLFGNGVVYQLDPAGHETLLHSFALSGGVNPYAGVTMDAAGNLYGTTYAGGMFNYGVVYKLDASGHETVLHNFARGSDGAFPYSGVTLDAAGNLYGTTEFGGAADCGVVYELGADSRYTILHSFADTTDGCRPASGVTVDSIGNIYGTVYWGGIVYEVDSTGSFHVLHSSDGGPDGGEITSGVILDSSGNLYGTALYGTYGQGVVYELDTAGNWSVLYSFTGGSDGGWPTAGLALDSDGNLYGTTAYGGPHNAGVVYKLSPPAPVRASRQYGAP